MEWALSIGVPAQAKPTVFPRILEPFEASGASRTFLIATLVFTLPEKRFVFPFSNLSITDTSATWLVCFVHPDVQFDREAHQLESDRVTRSIVMH